MQTPNTFLQFRAYGTGRPAYIDPTKVGAITDTVIANPPRIAGADPSLEIVGATVIVDGAAVSLGEDAAIVREAIEAYRAKYSGPILASFKTN